MPSFSDINRKLMWLGLWPGLRVLCLRWEMCLGRSPRGLSPSFTSPAGQTLGFPLPPLGCLSSSKKSRPATLSTLAPLWSTVGKWIKAYALDFCLFFFHPVGVWIPHTTHKSHISVSQCGCRKNRYLHCDWRHVGHDDRREEGRRVWLRHQDQSPALSDGPDWCKSCVDTLHWEHTLLEIHDNFY